MPNATSILPTRLTHLATLARLRLFWERYAPVLAVPALILSIYLILTMLGLWEVAGDPLRLIALIATLTILTRGALAARALPIPTRSDALRRLEITAGLAHRPLDTLQDQPVLAPDLWPAHLSKARTQADTIRRIGRMPALSPVDRYGLRILMPIGLGLAVFLSLGVSSERVRQSLSPSWLVPTNPYAVTFEAWVDSPDYTGRPPIYAQGDAVIRAPEGSTLVVRASGASNLPRPRYIGDRGSRFLSLVTLGRNSVEVRTHIDSSGQLDWRIGPRRQQFLIDAMPDQKPTITITDPSEIDKRNRLVLVFDAGDDYGVEQVLLEMVELSDDLNEAAAFDAHITEFDTQSGGFVDAERRSLKLDLTRHPLAGKKVVARLVAIDGAEQRGTTEPFYITVPDKIFVEPLAKAIVEQRALLLAGQGAYVPAPEAAPDMDASDGTFDTYQTVWRLGRAPVPVQRTVELIEAVTDYPNPSLFNDPVVYIGLRHAAKTLRYARSSEAIAGLPDHMWKLAIRAEFGVLGSALQEMQEAQEALREGIARRAPQREIDALFARYNQAVDAYMEELRKNATIVEGNGEGGVQAMGSVDEIQALLDAIEEANRIGDTEGARRALAQLAELLENMQMQLTQGSGQGDSSGQDEMSEEMRESLEDLAETLGEQRELQDQTRQTERDAIWREFGEEESGESLSPEDLAQRQAEIEQLIQGLQERLAEQEAEQGTQPAPGKGDHGEQGGGDPGEEDAAQQSGDGETGGQSQVEGEGEIRSGQTETSGEAFGRARDAMRESEAALRRGELGRSRQAQAGAIRALREAGDALAQERARAEWEQTGGGDPLGRDEGGFDSDNAETDIDTRDNAERSREILDELRRRASEAEREQQEQDYLDRLLKRF